MSRRRPPTWQASLAGAAAGAAGTTALNAVTYLDMVLRARPASSTPDKAVERLSELTHVPIPGEAQARENRVAGLGPLSGLGAGVAIGVALALTRRASPPMRPGPTMAVAALGAMLATNGPMAVSGFTDPRSWRMWLIVVVVSGAVAVALIIQHPQARQAGLAVAALDTLLVVALSKPVLLGWMLGPVIALGALAAPSVRDPS